jgi:putative membrane protein
MLAKSLFAFLHFTAAFGIAAMLVYEWATFSKSLTVVETRRIGLADRWYGICAGVLLAAGFARAIYFEKGWAFYAQSPFFRVKLSLFLLMGVLSIYPTIRFIRWRRDLKADRAPTITASEHSIISASLALQLMLLLGVLLSASLMANGVFR